MATFYYPTQASVGNIGTYLQSVFSTTSAGTSAQYANMASLSLTTTGDYDIFFQVYGDQNGATITGQFYNMVISAFSGNTTTDHVLGDNRLLIALTTGPTLGSGMVYWRRTVSTPTTYYAKTQITYSAGTPNFAGKMWARIAKESLT